MNDQQPELLEQFLQALRQNPHALPPDGLEPELAEFARRVVQQSPSPTLNARRRMWEQALAQSRITSNGHFDDKELHKMAVITARPETSPRNNTRFPLTLLAAGFAALLFISIYMMLPKGSPNFSALGAPNQQQATFTPIPSLIPVITSTPTPAQGTISNLTGESTPMPYTGQAILLSGYVYAPVISQSGIETQVQRENTAHSVMSSELVYRVTLSDGSVIYVEAQPPAMSLEAVSIEQLFPGVMVVHREDLTLGGHPAYSLLLTNGITVIVDATTNQILQFYIALPSTGNPAIISSDGIAQTDVIPVIANPINPTPVTDNPMNPTSVPPTVPPPDVIIVTATPIPAIVITATPPPTVVP